MVLGEAALVGEASLLLLDVGGVRQEDRGQFTRVAGREDRSAISVADQPGEPTAVVDVGVGDDDGVDGGRIDREDFPVRQSVAFDALEQPCVDEHPHLIGSHEEAAARDSPGCAEELQSDHAVDSRIEPAAGTIGDANEETTCRQRSVTKAMPWTIR